MKTQFKKVGDVIIEYSPLNDYDATIFLNRDPEGRKLHQKLDINKGSYYLASEDNTIQKFEHWQNGYYYGRINGELTSYCEDRVHKIFATSDGSKYPGIPTLTIDDLLRCKSSLSIEEEVVAESMVSN